MKGPENFLPPQPNFVHEGSNDPRPSLRESFGVGKNVTKKQIKAMDIIDGLDLDPSRKMLLFSYHLWAETGSYAPIKEFGETREDIDQMLKKAMEDSEFTERYDIFYQQYEEYEEYEAGVEVLKKINKLLPEAEAVFFQSNPIANEVLKLKQEKKNNKDIAQALGLSVSRVNKIDRALVIFKRISPTKSRKKVVEKQNLFLFRVVDLRLSRLGNQDIANNLDVPIEKVEDAAKLLLFIKLIKPLTKSEGGKVRWQREKYKEEVKRLLNSIDPAATISLRTLHKKSGIAIGYDRFLSICHEIETEQIVPHFRKYKSRKSTS